MSVGVIILAHNHLNRARQLAVSLAGSGMRVALHIDRAVDDQAFEALAKSIKNQRNILLADRIACDWGRFSLVRAGMGAARQLLTAWSDISHVIQISGSCLPVRAISELRDFLKCRPGTDFVESVPAGDDWVQSGLGHERFLYHFPFSWKKQRWLFDRSVDVQRALRVRRRIPDGLNPHLGSQWWCLTAKTLQAILNDPRRDEFDRYFAGTWIPDESYVPTLAQRHSAHLVSRSLTLSRFDDQGKPHVFYDDHADLLAQTDHFFARKIWHGADKLYQQFLHRNDRIRASFAARPIDTDLGLDRMFEDARALRCKGRKGIRHAGRFPAAAFERQPSSARPYHVLIGFGQVFDGFHHWLSNTTGCCVHGRVFQSDRVVFNGGWRVPPAGLSANPEIRDTNPEQFLTNLIWARRSEHQCLMFEIADSARMAAFFARDPNAILVDVRGSWMLDVFQRKHSDPQILRNQARRLSREARTFATQIAAAGENARLRSVDLADLLAPGRPALRALQEELSPHAMLRPNAMPPSRDLSGLPVFLDQLRLMSLDTSELMAGTDTRHATGKVQARA